MRPDDSSSEKRNMYLCIIAALILGVLIAAVIAWRDIEALINAT